MKIACVLITRLRAKVEMRRRPDLRDRPAVIVGRCRGRPVVVDCFPAATGVAVGMTPEQALSRQPDGILLEADEAAYGREFRRMLASLQGVSDRVEGAELGVAYVGVDGLEAMYGGEARLVTALLNAVPQDLSPRVGVGDAKFPAYVAARAARPLGTVRVPQDVAGFLSSHPVDFLPVSEGIREELGNFGLRTLGDVAAMSVDALADRFGAEGRRAWELCHGIDNRPVVPLRLEESIAEHIALPFASASLELLLAAADTLLSRAYARPRMQGRYAGGVDLECALYHAHPWRKEIHFKQPAGDWRQASRIVRGQLEADYPPAPVEDVSLALSNVTGESGTQLSLLAGVRHDRERRLAGAERQLQARTGGRPALYRVAQVAPWHPAPEMRAMRVPVEAAGADGMKPLALPSPVAVQEGPEGEPAAVLLGERWQEVARIEDTWHFDLWWMPQPLTRTYYRVGRADGGEVTLFRDQRQGCWFRQAP